MRINQGYISQSIADFPFLETCQLQPYRDLDQPAIFFGCYSEADFQTIATHRGIKVIFWTGQDAMDCIFYGWHISLGNCHHITCHPNIARALASFLSVKIVKPAALKPDEWNVTPLGKRIFAYCPTGHPTYHNIDLIKKLQAELPYKFIIGDGTLSQQEWITGAGNQIYDKCFIGLVLNNFAGGGQTIIELGLKGRPVITNGLENMPHILRWKTFEDIKQHVNNAYHTRAEVSRTAVLNSLDQSFHFLNLNNYAQP